MENNKNNILNWSFDKPTETGFYLACKGDAETERNIKMFRLVKDKDLTYEIDISICGGVIFSVSDVATWHKSFKFARLCVGYEANMNDLDSQ